MCRDYMYLKNIRNKVDYGWHCVLKMSIIDSQCDKKIKMIDEQERIYVPSYGAAIVFC